MAADPLDGDSARERRLRAQSRELAGALDRARAELDHAASEVHIALGDLKRAEASRTWRSAKFLGGLARAGTAGQANLHFGELEVAHQALTALDRRLIPPPARTRTKRRRLRIAVVSWDMAHNGAARAHHIAEMLQRSYDVQHIGPCFPHFGSAVWEPIRGAGRQRTYVGCELPEFVARTERFLHGLQVDLVYVCKARFPSLLIGMVLKHNLGVPVIVDIDESELGFVGAKGPVTFEQFTALGDYSGRSRPSGKLWTQLSQTLVADADAVVVSSEVLQPLFGGTVVPHVRDELTFNPARYDRDEVRAGLGYGPDDRVVMFAGTANRHKRLLDIAAAVAGTGDARYKLCVVGGLGDPMMRLELANIAPERTQLLGARSVREIPRLTVAADVVCLPQQVDSDIADYQTPAKLTEALAMGVPVLAGSSPPLQPYIAAGIVQELHESSLTAQLLDLFAEPAKLRRAAREGRELFLEQMSFSAGLETVDALVDELYGTSTEVPPSWLRAYSMASRPAAHPGAVAGLGPAAPGTAPRRPASRRPVSPTARWDVVLFWRLPYSDVYGRRPDLLIKYLAQSERTRRLVLFDRPVDWGWIESRQRAARSGVNHFGLIARRARRLAFRAERRGKLTKHMFVSQPVANPRRWQRWFLPRAEEYLGYVERALAREHIGERNPLMFVVWPPLPEFADLQRLFAPDLTLTDVVDDERSFTTPGTSAHEHLTRDHELILSASDLVITHNQPLADRLTMFGVDAHVVGNATELFDVRRRRRPRDLRRIKGPIIGYSGNLSVRFDVRLVDRLAQARPDCSLVIIGSAHGAEDVLALTRHANVHFLGVKRYPEVTRYVRCFDVGIIPHLDDALSRSMNPLKAYMYTACGVPSVATNVANLARLGEAITIVDSHDAFIAAVSDVLERRARGELVFDPAALLSDQTWKHRVREIEQLMDQAIGRPEGAVAMRSGSA